MSYDIRLIDPVTRTTIQLPAAHVMTGGTYRATMDAHGNWIPEPIRDAWLNVTYNYAIFYEDAFDPVYKPEHECAETEDRNGRKAGYLYGIRSIYGMTGAESIPILQRAANKLSDDVHDNYWKATEGNAKRPLLRLAAMAQLRPDGIWDGD